MLKSFFIKNFRIFRELEIKHLSRINLIIGQNNVGKSSFLEAIKIYASQASQDVLFELVDTRQENWFNEYKIDLKNATLQTIRHLFYEHKLPELGEEGIRIGETYSNPQLHINIMPYQIQKEEGILRKIPISLSDLKLKEQILDLAPSIVVKQSGKHPRLIDRQIFKDKFISYPLELDGINCQSIPIKKNRDKKLSKLWDLTSLTPLTSDIIKQLKLMENKITGIAFVEPNVSQSNYPRIPFVKLEGVEEPLAMKTLGDGINNLFEILLCLVNSKDGFLLIDELENGLYWEIQPKVWEAIFQVAERLNVQVFATTHSNDCVQAFRKIWNKYPESGYLFRLDSKAGEIKPTNYTLELLNDSLDSDVDVR